MEEPTDFELRKAAAWLDGSHKQPEGRAPTTAEIRNLLRVLENTGAVGDGVSWVFGVAADLIERKYSGDESAFTAGIPAMVPVE